MNYAFYGPPIVRYSPIVHYSYNVPQPYPVYVPPLPVYPSGNHISFGLQFSTGTPYVNIGTRLSSNLVAYGYDQGYRDAQYARSIDTVVTYNDPYDPYVYTTYGDVGYDPYSSFGENRHCLSVGYEAGYRDAMRQMEPVIYYQNDSVDMVSAMITAVITI